MTIDFSYVQSSELHSEWYSRGFSKLMNFQIPISGMVDLQEIG